MSGQPGPILIGTHTWPASGDTARRNDAGIASLKALHNVSIVNVQFREKPHEVPGLTTLATMPRDSNVVTGRRGPRKPVIFDQFDALATEAAARGCPYFCFTNTDIQISQAAIDWVRQQDREATILVRRNTRPGTGEPTTIELSGMDVFVIRPEWWLANRYRFRAYLAGEGVWDNVYTTIILCHADAILENRRSLVHHEEHPMMPLPSKEFGKYIQKLAAFDAGYFSLWHDYFEGISSLRAAGASEDEENAFARRTFVWNPPSAKRALQLARNIKALGRYGLWKLRNQA